MINHCTVLLANNLYQFKTAALEWKATTTTNTAEGVKKLPHSLIVERPFLTEICSYHMILQLHHGAFSPEEQKYYTHKNCMKQFQFMFINNSFKLETILGAIKQTAIYPPIPWNTAYQLNGLKPLCTTMWVTL